MMVLGVCGRCASLSWHVRVFIASLHRLVGALHAPSDRSEPRLVPPAQTGRKDPGVCGKVWPREHARPRRARERRRTGQTGPFRGRVGLERRLRSDAVMAAAHKPQSRTSPGNSLLDDGRNCLGTLVPAAASAAAAARPLGLGSGRPLTQPRGRPSRARWRPVWPPCVPQRLLVRRTALARRIRQAARRVRAARPSVWPMEVTVLAGSPEGGPSQVRTLEPTDPVQPSAPLRQHPACSGTENVDPAPNNDADPVPMPARVGHDA